MKDKLGDYYYPYAENKKVRMYVRIKNGSIEFRIRNDADPKMWSEHGWISQEAIEQAKALYVSKSGFDPNQAYDIHIAREVLQITLQKR